MRKYLDALSEVYVNGEDVQGRNGVTREVFGLSSRYSDVGHSFPLLTTKKMAFKPIVGELLAFLRGYTDVRSFNKLGCHVWDANATSPYWESNPNYSPNYLGQIYGAQWRNWRGKGFPVDQIEGLIDDLKRDKRSRRHIVTAWNPSELDDMCLPPCHVLWQCHVDGRDRLSIQIYQRSCDMFLGVPFNIASYSLLILILSRLTGYKPGSLIHVMGSAHIYAAHFEQAVEQLNRLEGAPCQVKIADRGQTRVEDFIPDDFSLVNYFPQPAIKAKMVL